MNDADQPENFAKYITDNYEVAAHWKDRGDLFTGTDENQSSGFSGTLFKSKISGQYVLALRGTAGGKDLFIQTVAISLMTAWRIIKSWICITFGSRLPP